MTLNFFTIITLFSVFLTFTLSLFFVVTKKGHRVENIILGSILVIFNIQIIYSFLTSEYTFQYFLGWHKIIFLLRQTSLLIGPLLYFYFNSFLKRKNILTYQNLLHLIPFAAAIIFLLIFYSRHDRFIIWLSLLNFYDTIIILASNLLYLILSYRDMSSMNLGFDNIYKSIKTSTHNTWLQILLLGFIVLWILNLNSFALFTILNRPEWCAYTASIYSLTAFLFVNAIMIILLINPDIYYVITKYKNNKLKEQDKDEYLQRLNSFMEVNKPFFNPEISLELLASEISVSPRILSQLINETFNKSFKSYILEFRIKESMRILADATQRDLTVLEVLYMVGFNSKSAFNNQFKLHTSLTPLEYRSKFLNG